MIGSANGTYHFIFGGFMETGLTIVVEGGDKSGKGHMVALLARFLRGNGLDVRVQLEETHNAPKMQKTNDELVAKLNDKIITIFEQQT